MFVVENEFKNANISRTVRFTELIFEELNKVASKNNILFSLLVLQCCKYALDNVNIRNHVGDDAHIVPYNICCYDLINGSLIGENIKATLCKT